MKNSIKTLTLLLFVVPGLLMMSCGDNAANLEELEGQNFELVSAETAADFTVNFDIDGVITPVIIPAGTVLNSGEAVGIVVGDDDAEITMSANFQFGTNADTGENNAVSNHSFVLDINGDTFTEQVIAAVAYEIQNETEFNYVLLVVNGELSIDVLGAAVNNVGVTDIFDQDTAEENDDVEIDNDDEIIILGGNNAFQNILLKLQQ